LAEEGTKFIEIAGNSQILISLLGSRDGQDLEDSGQELFSIPMLTRPGVSRVVSVCSVIKLSDVLREERAPGLTVEHVYDY
jgi:hypothetical protein